MYITITSHRSWTSWVPLSPAWPKSTTPSPPPRLREGFRCQGGACGGWKWQGSPHSICWWGSGRASCQALFVKMLNILLIWYTYVKYSFLVGAQNRNSFIFQDQMLFSNITTWNWFWKNNSDTFRVITSMIVKYKHKLFKSYVRNKFGLINLYRPDFEIYNLTKNLKRYFYS